MNIEQRLAKAIENDVDYADPGLTQLLKDALDEINNLREYCKLKDRLVERKREHSENKHGY